SDVAEDADANTVIFSPAVQQVNALPFLGALTRGDDLAYTSVVKIPYNLDPEYEFLSLLPAFAGATFGSQIDIDGKGRIHMYNEGTNNTATNFVYPYTQGAISEGNQLASGSSGTNYFVLSPNGASVEYGTTVISNINTSRSSNPRSIYVTQDGTAYIQALAETVNAPVTPSYRDQDADAQVTVLQADAFDNMDLHIAVFHDVIPAENTINDFPMGNNTFCVNGLIYQAPNDGPITGNDPSSTFISGDGSSPTHNLPDIKFGASTIPHPQPQSTDYLWQLSRDGGTSWQNGLNGVLPVYKPQPEPIAGTVQYRRLAISGCDTLISNIATASITGDFDLSINDASDPIYFCPTVAKDLGISVSDASGNISWQWYNGFNIIEPGIITPSSGSGDQATFSADLTATSEQAGTYRLVVTDAGGCKREQLVALVPLTEQAYVEPQAIICPGGTADVTIGPAVVNPLFDYMWSGPSSFTSMDPNPTVSETGVYSLQVKLTTDADFCAAGETSVEVVANGDFDPVLVAMQDFEFCQSDAPGTIGLAGPAPAGYAFQWSPSINLNNATLFNPTFDPGSLPFGTTPIAEVEYTFTALRLRDGCIFETTTTVSDTALGFAFAGNDKIGDGCNIGMRFDIGGESTFGGNYEWTAVGTSFPGGLGALTGDAAYGLDAIGQQVGTNKFLKANFPLAVDAGGEYYIDFELKAAYVPFPTNCFTRDTMRLIVVPCGAGPTCPEPVSNVVGDDGICGGAMTALSVNSLDEATYEWTTYSVDGDIQAPGTAPQGLFELIDDGFGTLSKGAELAASGPHSTEVIVDFDDPTWGWAGANNVVYQVTQTVDLGAGPLSCFTRQIVFSSEVAGPVVDLNDQLVCSFQAGTAIGSPTNVTPYTLSGADYNQAPNSALEWSWMELDGDTESITSGGDTPFPTLDPLASESYEVTVRDPLTGCVAVDTFVLTVVPIIANAGDDLSNVCANTIIQIGSAPQANLTYEWSPSAGLERPIGMPNNTVANPFVIVGTTTQTYTLTVTNTLTGCQATDMITITPSTPTITSIDNETVEVCETGGNVDVRLGGNAV
ncbi:MAG: hypothetical protein AAF242_10210, partial [Bacteroidota bacterium]